MRSENSTLDETVIVNVAREAKRNALTDVDIAEVLT